MEWHAETLDNLVKDYQTKQHRFETFLAVFNAYVRDGWSVSQAITKAKTWEDYYTDGIEGNN